MSPPDFSKEPPIVVEKNNTVNRENLVNTAVTTGQFYSYEANLTAILKNEFTKWRGQL